MDGVTVYVTGKKVWLKNSLSQSEGGMTERGRVRVENKAKVWNQGFFRLFQETKEVCTDNQYNVNKLRTAPLSNSLKKTGEPPH